MMPPTDLELRSEWLCDPESEPPPLPCHVANCDGRSCGRRCPARLEACGSRSDGPPYLGGERSGGAPGAPPVPPEASPPEGRETGKGEP
jgi:hypothetical protein